MEQWVIVPNWDRFQHYKDRVPPWIKLYTAELAHNPEWERLTAAQRGLLVTCWVEYALSKGRATTEHIASTLGAGFKHAYFKPLVDAGFIQLSASKPLALTRSREKEVPPKGGTKKGRRSQKRSGGAPSEEKQAALSEAAQLAAGWNGSDSDAFAAAVDEIARQHHTQISDAERIDLWNAAFEW